MKILVRYLDAVRQSMFLIPALQRDDILRELEEDLRAQFEEREIELGRPLTEEEADQILQRSGHPLLVAGRYRQGVGTLSFGRQLIGPELFPLYRLILTINLSLTAIAVAGIVLTFDRASDLNTFLQQLMLQAAIITTIFIGVEASIRRRVERGWSMLSMPEPEERNRISRATSIVELVTTLIFANIWINLTWHPGFTSRKGITWTPGPVWDYFHDTFYLPVLLVMLVSIAISIANLIHPHRTPAKLAAGALASFGFVAMAATALLANGSIIAEQIAALRSGVALGPSERLAAWTNVNVFAFLAIATIIVLVQGIYEMLKAAQSRGDGLSGQSPSIPSAAL